MKIVFSSNECFPLTMDLLLCRRQSLQRPTTWKGMYVCMYKVGKHVCMFMYVCMYDMQEGWYDHVYGEVGPNFIAEWDHFQQ